VHGELKRVRRKVYALVITILPTMTSFHGLEFTHDNIWAREELDRSHWYALDHGLYPRFRKSLRQFGKPPTNITIQFQHHADSFRYVSDIDQRYQVEGMWVYETHFGHVKIMIAIRQTGVIALQLSDAQFPVRGFTIDRWDAHMIPMEITLLKLSGELACVVHPPLGMKGRDVAMHIIQSMGKSLAWGLELVHYNGTMLAPDEPVGRWAFGPMGYLFAVPKSCMPTDAMAIESFLFNPVYLHVQAP
jgi:hypothetical protein